MPSPRPRRQSSFVVGTTCGLALAACFQAQSPTTVSGDIGGSHGSSTRRGAGAAAGGGSGSSAATVASAATTGSTSSTGGNSTGSSGLGTSSAGSSSGGSGGSSGAPPAAFVCAQDSTAPLTTSCPGAVAFNAQVVDGISCVEIGGATLSAVGTNGVPLSGVAAVSASDGAFVFCLPFRTPLTVEAVAQSYLNTYLAELVFSEDGGVVPLVGQIALIQEEFVGAFSSLVPGGYDSTKGFVVADVGNAGVCGDATAGWTFSLTLDDGGAVPDGGYSLIYLGSSGIPDSSATETSSEGSAIFVNVDIPASGYVMVSASKEDAGACPLLSGLGFTGRVLVGENAGSFAPFIMP